MTRDPIKDGRNWYAYCQSNPLSYADNNGLKNWFLIGARCFGWEAAQSIVGAIGGIGGQWESDSESTFVVRNSWLAGFLNSYISLGPIILAPDDKLKSSVMEHEKVHQTQSALLGPSYLPATAGGYVLGGTLNLFFNFNVSKEGAHDGSPLEAQADHFSGDKNLQNSNWLLQRIYRWF